MGCGTRLRELSRSMGVAQLPANHHDVGASHWLLDTSVLHHVARACLRRAMGQLCRPRRRGDRRSRHRCVAARSSGSRGRLTRRAHPWLAWEVHGKDAGDRDRTGHHPGLRSAARVPCVSRRRGDHQDQLDDLPLQEATPGVQAVAPRTGGGGEPRILPRRLSVEVADPHSRGRPLLASAPAAE